jgi:DNA-binding MarR family transcriptional regulator
VVLGFRGSQRPADLAQALGVDPSTATRMCDRLVRKHLITRRRDVVDRRVVLLDLSAPSRRLVDRVTRWRRQEIGRILDAVGPVEHGASGAGIHELWRRRRGPRGRLATQLGAVITSLSARWRGLRTKAGQAVATSSYLRRWALLGALIDVIAGLVAVVFFAALKLATRLFLHLMAAFSVPNPVAEGGGMGSSGFSRPWAVPLVVALGGL